MGACKTPFPCFLAFALLANLSALAQQNDWLIIPGKRLGPITPNSTRTDLVRFFGPANVVNKAVDTGEGPEDATVVLPGDSSQSLAIFWWGDRMAIEICYERSTRPCKWHPQNGVSLGTTLATLETLNGAAFEILGWGTDQGCPVTSWRGGKLAAAFEPGGSSDGWPTGLRAGT
jgi:hypothetical protein